MKTTLLIDCGTGVLSNLQKYVGLLDVSDIVITHMHADHFFDLIPYRYALKYGIDNPQGLRPKLHLPPKGIKEINQVVGPFSESDDFLGDVFEVSEYSPDRKLRLGDLILAFAAVAHYVPAYAVSVSGIGGKIAYSSDSGPCPGLFHIAKDADIFICGVGRSLEPDSDSLWGHLRPTEAGELAKEVNVKRLLLTHLWPSSNRATILDESSAKFGGFTELAEECRTYQLADCLGAGEIR